MSNNKRSVESLIEELRKFPKNALCSAYEGESNGINIVVDRNYGFIHLECLKMDNVLLETELINCMSENKKVI